MPDKEFKLKYKIRNRAAKVLKRVIAEDGLIDTGTLYDSVRINAKFTTEGNLRIEILAAYYFGFFVSQNGFFFTTSPYLPKMRRSSCLWQCFLNVFWCKHHS